MERHRLGDLQLAILEVLWDRGEATTGEVHQALLEARGLAPTTIATMLRKMDDRGLVAHRRDGRILVHRAAVPRDSVHRSMVEDLVERLFGGDPRELVNHLVREGELGQGDLDAIRRKVAKARRSGGRGGAEVQDD